MKVSQGQVIMKAIELAQSAASLRAVSITTMIERTRARRDVYSGWQQEWAADFLDCLPADPLAVRLIFLSYLPVYVCNCDVMHFHQGRCDDCGEFAEVYQWQPGEKQRLGGIAKAFWGRVQNKRLFSTGLKIAERAI